MSQDDEIPNKKLKSEAETQHSKNDSPTIDNVKSSELPTSSTSLSISLSTSSVQRPKISCKNPKFSYIEPGGKKFVWKSLKQIVTQERSLPWTDDVVLCMF